MTHGSLFSGIGGFDLAAEWMGWDNKFHCEWNEFGQKVLKYYWPDAESFTDITKTDFTKYANRIDILTGGFPCQPYSLAGKRKGKEDERHLWPEMLRAIREIQPRWVVGENVFGLINWSDGLVFHEVQTDLEAAGYEVWPYVLPACAVNAPHRRDRVWFIAFKNTDNDGRECKFREKEPCERKQRNFSTRNNERVRTNNDKIEVTPNPHSNGQQRSNSEHEINASERGQYAQRNVKQMGDNVTDSPGESSRGELQQRQKQGQLRGCNSNNNGKSRVTANPQCSGRQSGEEYWEALAGWFAETSLSDYWQNFPTQSPICTRNDGLPAELDGITFPKWRNESIKAAGNAIVPQVALQIFKAIEQYEQQNS